MKNENFRLLIVEQTKIQLYYSFLHTIHTMSFQSIGSTMVQFLKFFWKKGPKFVTLADTNC